MNVTSIKKTFVLLALNCVATYNILLAQELDINFDRLLIEEGLTSVNAIHQDTYGFMWFGGPHGLYRYDGHYFKVYQNEPNDTLTLSGNDITKVYQDSRGFLWVGTRNSGVNRFNYQNGHFQRFENILELSTSHILEISEDNSNNIYIGTLGKGLVILDNSLENYRVFRTKDRLEGAISNNDVFSVIQTIKGEIYVATNSGSLDVYNPDTGLFDQHFYRKEGHSAVRTGQSLVEDINGNIWIGTEGDGLYFFNPQNKEIKHFTAGSKEFNISNNVITDIKIDHSGGLWLTTDGGGLNWIGNNGAKFRQARYDPYNEFSLSNNSSYSLYIDSSDKVWLGMGDGEVNVSKSDRFKFYRPTINPNKNGLSFRVVVDLIEDSNGKMWIGTGGGGIDVLDIASEYFVNYSSIQQFENRINTDIILCLTEASNGSIWAGTFLGGIIEVASNGEIRTHKHSSEVGSISNDHVFAVDAGKNGDIWIGTHGGGLNRWRNDLKKFEHYRHDEGDINTLVSDKVISLDLYDQKLWVGTYNGGIQGFNVDTEDFINYNSLFGTELNLSNFPIHDISVESDTLVLISTGGTGLIQFNPDTESVRTYTTKTGLPSNSVYGAIMDHSNHIWGATNKGLFRVIPISNRVDVLNKNDGILSSDFEAGSIVEHRNGNLYFASKKGILGFNPDVIFKDQEDVSVELTEFRILNQVVNPKELVNGHLILKKSILHTEQIRLPYELNNFSVQFSAPKTKTPGKTKFRFKLNPLDDQWFETSSYNAMASFSNLREGEYELMITASGNGKDWAGPVRMLKVIIEPPLWRTWQAYLLYLFVVISLLYIFYTTKINRIKLQNEIKLEKYKHDKDNEVHDLKLAFFTNISHELRTPITLILGPLERLIKNKKLDNRSRNQLMVIQRNGQRLLSLITQLLDFRKSDTGNSTLQLDFVYVKNMLDEITHSFQEVARQKQIDFKLELEIDNDLYLLDSKKVDVILFNLLSNSFKFTGVEGKVKIKIKEEKLSEDQTHIWFTVEDNGIGIKFENQEKIFERYYEVESKPKPRLKGTGIGLALVKNYVDIHNGKIFLESTEGEGTKISFYIPTKSKISEQKSILQKPLDNNHLVVSRDELNDAIKDQGENELPIMLIVEDNTELLGYLVDGFNNSFQIHKAENGKIGHMLAAEVIPDIIISDVMMPELDGIEMCRLIKLDNRTSHIPIVLLTARVSMEYHLEGLETGADDYITKPFSFDLLTTKVVNLLETRKKLKEHITKEALLKPKEIAFNNPDEAFLEKLMSTIEDHMSDENFNVKILADKLAMSHSVLYRKTMALTDKSINEFIRHIRLQRAMQMFNSGSSSISEVAYSVGFSNPKYFSTCFKSEFGKSPSDIAN